MAPMMFQYVRMGIIGMTYVCGVLWYDPSLPSSLSHFASLAAKLKKEGQFEASRCYVVFQSQYVLLKSLRKNSGNHRLHHLTSIDDTGWHCNGLDVEAEVPAAP